MSTRIQSRLGASSVVLLAVAFIAAVIISNQLFQGAKIDLTANRLYTLSDGTERILENIDEPINLYLFWSDKAAEGIPTLRDYANRVREMLEEFEDTADGKIRLSVIDPLPFSEDEDRAAQFGLQGVGLAGSQDPVYLGLAGTDSVDNEEIIPFFQPDKESFLEYDLAATGQYAVESRANRHRPGIRCRHGRTIRSADTTNAATVGGLYASGAAVRDSKPGNHFRFDR